MQQGEDTVLVALCSLLKGDSDPTQEFDELNLKEPLLKEGSKVVEESSGRSPWRMARGNCGEWRKIMEESVVVENLQSTLVEVPNSGGWGVRY